VLLTTPESLHLMLAQKEYAKMFQNLEVVVIDEWHELLGTKRGVQVELGLSRLRELSVISCQLSESSALVQDQKQPINSSVIEQGRQPTTDNRQLKIWGISATIGNLEQAAEVLLGNNFPADRIKMIRANVDKKIVIKSVIPQSVEKLLMDGAHRLGFTPRGDEDCG
jgi:ATP-dependent Lhr-like helicase